MRGDRRDVSPIDRVAADRPFYSGKHRRHGMNLQVISAPDGEILWVSGPLPGAVHDLTASRIWGILRELAASGLIVLADKGYTGAGDHAASPPRRRTLTPPTPSYDPPASAPTPSSRPGVSCANSAAAPGVPGNSPKPSTSFRPARLQDEKRSFFQTGSSVLLAARLSRPSPPCPGHAALRSLREPGHGGHGLRACSYRGGRGGSGHGDQHRLELGSPCH